MVPAGARHSGRQEIAGSCVAAAVEMFATGGHTVRLHGSGPGAGKGRAKGGRTGTASESRAVHAAGTTATRAGSSSQTAGAKVACSRACHDTSLRNGAKRAATGRGASQTGASMRAARASLGRRQTMSPLRSGQLMTGVKPGAAAHTALAGRSAAGVILVQAVGAPARAGHPRLIRRRGKAGWRRRCSTPAVWNRPCGRCAGRLPGRKLRRGGTPSPAFCPARFFSPQESASAGGSSKRSRASLVSFLCCLRCRLEQN